MPTPTGRKRLGELLIEAGLINEQDLNVAIQEGKRTGLFVGHVLIHQGKISREQLGRVLSIQHNTKYISLANITLDSTLLALLPEQFIRDKKVLPVGKERGRLVVAMVNPSDRAAIDEVTFITGMRPLAAVTTHLEFAEAYHKFFGERSSSNLQEGISSIAAASQDDAADNIRMQRDAEITDTSNPLVKLVNSIIEEAIERNASDIHIEPRNKKYLVRFRVDGILKPMLDVPQNMEASLVTRIKVMARMDIAEHRRPQDGRIALAYKGVEFNLRVNTLPISDGREKIVIRILRPTKNVSDFQALGFTPDEISKLEQLYKSPWGIILVCGPTGSGKTTTLYTVLNEINDDIRNISTVEDPVELSIEGLNQSQVNHKAEYTFASSLRALLRQDPDVVMVGEIRDYETLESAIHASLTGHLVFSTIHSNTTAATITRMMEMGASANLISSSIIGIIAQRLLRRICPNCKEQYTASPEEKKVLFPYEDVSRLGEIHLYRGKGCDLCGGSGYSGRSGVYEILVVDREIRQIISSGMSDMQIEDAAVSAGMKTMGMNGRAKVLEGVSTLDEMIRVLGLSLGG